MKIINKLLSTVFKNRTPIKKDNIDDYANLIYYANLTKDYSIFK